jgi:Double-GTPase 2
MSYVGFVVMFFGCIIGPVLVAAVVAIGIPVFALGALASAIRAGEPKLPPFLRPKPKVAEPDTTPSADDLFSSLPDDEAGDEAAGEPAAEGTAPASAIRIGWKRHPDQAIALRSYYFGPLADDVVRGVRAVYLMCKATGQLADQAARSVDQFESGVPRVVIPVSLYVGRPIGLILGLAVTSVLGVTYVLISALSLAVAFCLCFLLRALDWFFCFAAGVARICLECGERVLKSPHYICPECGRQHDDIRPSGYGVLRRKCVCGQPMPTTLLTGAGTLQGICPAASCKGYLPPMWGRAREIVVPLFGSTWSGKTRLMYMMTTVLRDRVRDLHGEVTYIGDTGERLALIGDALAAGGQTEKTLVERPRGLGLFVKVGRTKRLVYFFDAAGEFYTRPELVAELKYLNKARTYVFVADPLAAKAVWKQFPPPMQDRLQQIRAARGEVEKSFQATINQMIRLARRNLLRRRSSELAFVVTKMDLLQSAGVDVAPITGATAEWARSSEGLNMGNLARRAEHSFTAVSYFCTAAIEADGHVDHSVQTLLGAILDHGDLRLGV